jgi:hypothetical protein
MQTLLSIDPGRCTGWAYWRNSQLEACGVTSVGSNPCPAVSMLLAGCQALVIELPQVYRAAQSKGDPNDLIQVAVEYRLWLQRGPDEASRVERADTQGRSPQAYPSRPGGAGTGQPA